jgi:GNAT superfamily N-acetyltransferase
MKLHVAEAGAADRADWLRLWQAWQAHMRGQVPAAVSAAAWASICDPASGLHALIARDTTGTPLGFATASRTPFAWTGSDILFLQDLFVCDAARGRGVGTALLRGVYDLADRLQAAQVLWMVDERDSGLQAFYARHAIRTPYLRYMRRPWPW